MTYTRRTLLRTALAAPAVLGLGTLGANAYPARKLSLVVPFDAGGSADRMARAIAQGSRRRSSHAGCPAAHAPIASNPATPATPPSARHGPDARNAQMVTAGATR